MDNKIEILLRFAPPAWTLYPLLGVFLVGCVVNGLWQAGLENALISEARADGEKTATIQMMQVLQELPITKM